MMITIMVMVDGDDDDDENMSIIVALSYGRSWKKTERKIYLRAKLVMQY